jgi:DNA-binding protein H-NS
MSTYRDVKAQISKLEKQAADLFKKEVADVIARIHGLMAEYGLTVADLGSRDNGRKKAGTAAKGAARQSGTPKYRDPISGKTWTGHGKAPAWIAPGNREKFLIKSARTAAKPVAKARTPKKAAKLAAQASTQAKAGKTTKAVTTKKPAPVKKAAVPKPAVKKPAARKVAPRKVAKKVVAVPAAS